MRRERIGDEAIDNCRWLETLDPRALASPLDGLAELSSLTLQMVRGAMEAFEGEDATKAQAVIAIDERIDRMEAQMFQDLARRPPPPPDVVPYVGLVLVARVFERMADHA